MHFRTVAFLAAMPLLAACGASAPQTAQPQPGTVTTGPEGRMLRVGEMDEGVITEQDPIWGSNGRFHLYRFDATAGERYVVEMTSEDFDTYLVVGDRPSGVFSPIAYDDDGGGDLDARVRFVAPATGTYWVLAQAYAEYGLGSYLISLDRLPAPIAATPVPLTIGASVDGELTEGDALDEYDEKSYDLYTFQAEAGHRYAITLASSDFDAYLVLGRTDEGAFEEIDRNDDGSGSTDSRIVFVPTESGTYSIHATSFDAGESGSYSVRVTELAPPGPATITTISIGQELRGTLDEDDQIGDDGSFYDIYRFRGREGQRVSITMSSNDLDSYLQLGEAADEFWEDHSDDDSAGGLDSRIVATLWRTGEYEIHANSLNADEIGSYTLTLEEMPESGPAEVRPIELGRTVEGEIEATDASLPDDSYYDIYTLRANGGDRLSITLRSDDFDSYLAFGPWRNDEIEITHSDDDSGGGLQGLDSQIQLTIPSTGTYAIRVNTLGGMEFGSYTLRVDRQ